MTSERRLRHRIAGIVLAAGASSRMGRPKALLPTERSGETFLARILATLDAAGVADLSVVAGANAAAIRAHLATLPQRVRLLVNRNPEAGQLSSVLTALDAIEPLPVDGLLLTLVDVPLVADTTVRRIVDAYMSSDAAVVRPLRDGRHGHPVIFDRALFAALRAANPDQGAREVIRRTAAGVLNVEISDAGAFLDIDTPEEYEKVFGSPLPAE